MKTSTTLLASTYPALLLFTAGFLFSTGAFAQKRVDSSAGGNSGQQYAEFRNRSLTPAARVRAELLVALDLDLARAHANLSRTTNAPDRKKFEPGFVELLQSLSGAIAAEHTVLNAGLQSSAKTGRGRVLVNTAKSGDLEVKIIFFAYVLNSDGSLAVRVGTQPEIHDPK